MHTESNSSLDSLCVVYSQHVTKCLWMWVMRC